MTVFEKASPLEIAGIKPKWSCQRDYTNGYTVVMEAFLPNGVRVRGVHIIHHSDWECVPNKRRLLERVIQALYRHLEWKYTVC